jgi:oxygen-dependent protoporphyrinogen oxidase
VSNLSQPPIAIIGGGITGCAAAYRLHQQKRRVRLFEVSDRLGGVIRSERSGEWLVEAGPNSMREDSAEITKLLVELRLDSNKCLPRPDARHRYLVRNNQLIAAPMSPKEVLTSKLLGFVTKAKLAAENLRRPKPREGDLPLAGLIRDHFGDEVVNYLLNPFVSGVFAGDPEKLSARLAFPMLWALEQKHGSLLRGFQAEADEQHARGRPFPPPSISFTNGLVSLPRALADPLPANSVEFGAKVEHLESGPAWKITWSRDGVSRTEEFETVLLTLPATALIKLTIGGRTPLAALSAVEHAPVASIFLGYPRHQVGHPLDGFGMLVPAAEKRSILGAIFSSTLFTRRAPVDHVALTVMVGGALRPELTKLPPDRLLTHVRRDLTELLGVTGMPVFARHHVWPGSLPQFNVGYERFLDVMQQCEKNHPRLFLGGHLRDGNSVTACLTSGFRLADKALV